MRMQDSIPFADRDSFAVRIVTELAAIGDALLVDVEAMDRLEHTNEAAPHPRI